MTVMFKGKARRLEALDIPRLAYTIGCGEDHLRAVLEVETRGGGFDRFGRIKMLFEPHVFFRELEGSERERAVHKGLAYRRWGERKYPSDSYPRLEAAMEINAEAALRSCSWGLGQIMGFNHRAAGYTTVAQMIDAFREDEATHLAAMVTFIVSNGLDDELRRKDWRGFARGYNGPGYEDHGYHLKLKRAFDKWQAIPDVDAGKEFTADMIDRADIDPNPPEAPKLTTRGMMLKPGMQGVDVKNLQSILHDLGYHVGAQDGKYGPILKAAVVAFQTDHDLYPDGITGELTWEKLAFAEPRPARQQVTTKELRDRGSETIASADLGQAATVGGIGILSMTDILNGGVEQAVDTAERLSDLGLLEIVLLWVQNNIGLVIAIVTGLAIFAAFGKIKKARVADHNTGAHLGR